MWAAVTELVCKARPSCTVCVSLCLLHANQLAAAALPKRLALASFVSCVGTLSLSACAGLMRPPGCVRHLHLSQAWLCSGMSGLRVVLWPRVPTSTRPHPVILQAMICLDFFELGTVFPHAHVSESDAGACCEALQLQAW